MEEWEPCLIGIRTTQSDNCTHSKSGALVSEMFAACVRSRKSLVGGRERPRERESASAGQSMCISSLACEAWWTSLVQLFTPPSPFNFLWLFQAVPFCLFFFFCTLCLALPVSPSQCSSSLFSYCGVFCVLALSLLVENVIGQGLKVFVQA